MKALVLAAGKSSRLYPLTSTLPKCLLPIGDATILDYQVRALLATGVTELVIVVGFQKEKIIDHLTARSYPLSIIYVENPEFDSSHPIRSLWHARQHLHGTVLFFHCDVLFAVSAIQQLIEDTHQTTLLYRNDAWDEEAGKIIVDRSGRVRELGKHIERGRASGEYLQVAKLDGAFCTALVATLEKRIARGHDSYTIDALNDVANMPTVEAWSSAFDGFAMEIDTPDDYAAAQIAWNTST
ncbi:MAG: phosphocholine cytidylyltransferase family protein [Candidatus Paceibacterota bacterium]